MNESLEVIIEINDITSFVATVANYTIIKPLLLSIDMFTLAVEKLENTLNNI